MSVAATIRIQQADFDVAQEIAQLSQGRTDVKVYGVNGNAQALEDIKKGLMTATAWQDSYTEGSNMIKLLPEIVKAHRLLTEATDLNFVGNIEGVDIPRGTADVVVCASQFESYGMVNVEAMASGKPVVSTRQGGPSETVAGAGCGFSRELVKPPLP